jgi:hypothetical protein
MADLQGLEWVFKCPAEVTDETIKAGFETLRLRLELELGNMPLTTTALLRAERLLSFYVRMKQAETAGYGEKGGFSSPNEEKQVNAMIQGMLRDWDDIVIRSRPTGKDEVLAVERKFKDIFVEVLQAVPMSEEVRNDLAFRFSRTVMAAGLDHG